MFDNIGKKLKTAAQVLAWLGIIASVIIGFIVLSTFDSTPFPGLLVIVLGSIGSWLSSLALYGFGQLIENTDAIAAQMNKPSAPKTQIEDIESNLPKL